MNKQKNREKGISKHNRTVDSNTPSEKPSNDLKKIMLIFSAVISAVIAVQYCNPGKEIDDEKKEQPVKIKPVEDDHALLSKEKEAILKADIPKYEKTSRPVAFSLPKGLDINEQEFNSVAVKAADTIRHHTLKDLAPSLSIYIDNMEEDIVAYLQNCFTIIAHQDKRVEKYIEKLDLDEDKMHSQMVDIINSFILPGGFYLTIRPAQGGSMIFSLRPVKQTYYVKISDSETSMEVPVIEFSEPVFKLNEDEDRMGGQLDITQQFVLIFNDTNRTAIKDYIKKNNIKLPRYNPSISEAELAEELREGNIRHEVTHKFLDHKFPNTAHIVDPKTEFYVPLLFTVDDIIIPLTKQYPPVMFQELCAVGAEMATQKGDSAYYHFMWMMRPEYMPIQYQLISILTPLITLKTAPKTNIRQNLVTSLRQGAVYPEKIQEMIGHDWYKQSYSRIVGAMMYQIGIDFFRKAEKGEYRKVTLK